MNNWSASLSIVTNPAIIMYVLKGVLFTLIISIIAVVLGIFIGSILALLRNYCTSSKNRIFC